MNLTVEHSRSRALDYLALTHPVAERLGLVSIFNRYCALAPQAEHDNGILLTAMTQARLAPSPVPLMHMPDWAETYAISELYGLPPSSFNDDACGRALDTLYPVLTQVWVDLLRRVRIVFGLDLRVIHTDVTLMQVEGDYDDIGDAPLGAQQPAQPHYGRTPKGFDPRRKQVGFSLSMTEQNLPAWWLAHDGNVADPVVYQQHLFALRTFLQEVHPIMVGDSKLPTEGNRLAFNRAGAFYVGPASLRPGDAQTLMSLWQSGVACERLTAWDQPSPTAAPFWGLDLCHESSDPEQPTHHYTERTVFVFSPEERRAVRHARAKALWKARAALCQLRARLNRGRYRTRAYIERHLSPCLDAVGDLISADVAEERDAAGQSRFRVHWRVKHDALRQAAYFDGWYRLLSNLPPADHTMAAVLAFYKGQSHVEGAFKQIKHWPIQVSPLWLHQPARIEALLGLTAIALLLTAILAQQLQQGIAQEPIPPSGLQPEGRDHLPITARRLWQIMVGLRIMTILLRDPDGSCWQLVTVDTPNLAQATVLRLLGWPSPSDYLPVGLRLRMPLEKCGKSD
jgi:transposase